MELRMAHKIIGRLDCQLMPFTPASFERDIPPLSIVGPVGAIRVMSELLPLLQAHRI